MNPKTEFVVAMLIVCAVLSAVMGAIVIAEYIVPNIMGPLEHETME
jgi:hypothetical protein